MDTHSPVAEANTDATHCPVGEQPQTLNWVSRVLLKIAATTTGRHCRHPVAVTLLHTNTSTQVFGTWQLLLVKGIQPHRTAGLLCPKSLQLLVPAQVHLEVYVYMLTDTRHTRQGLPPITAAHASCCGDCC
jgi:hypothetical protein